MTSRAPRLENIAPHVTWRDTADRTLVGRPSAPRKTERSNHAINDSEKSQAVWTNEIHTRCTREHSPDCPGRHTRVSYGSPVSALGSSLVGCAQPGYTPDASGSEPCRRVSQHVVAACSKRCLRTPRLVPRPAAAAALPHAPLRGPLPPRFGHSDMGLRVTGTLGTCLFGTET